MKLLSARLKGLIGICRASGLHEIYIDFTKCKHKLTLIIGRNGSGKSTIEDALHPLPDPPSKFLNGEEGLKELEYLTDDGIFYKIRIEYPINKNGDRTTTKAYIEKNIDGNIIELNTNGNIGSYKDILYTEFRLDSNFVSLSQLSVENRGLVDMTPAERKKFVGNIIDSVEIYNNMYKTLNKRSSIFKSMINTIVAKIDTIGNQENLDATLNSITNRIQYLESQKDILIKQLSDEEANVRKFNGDGDLQDRYNKIHDSNVSLKEDLKTAQIILTNLRTKSKGLVGDSLKSCEGARTSIKDEINKLENSIEINKSRLNDLLVKRDEESISISYKINRLNSLMSETNYDTLVSMIEELETNINDYLIDLEKMGLSPDTTLTKDEFIIGLNTLKQIKEQIDIMRSYNYDNEIGSAIEYINQGIDIARELDSMNISLEKDKISLNEMEKDIKYYSGLLDRLLILNNRPSDCINDNCSFIKDALEAEKVNPDTKIEEIEILREKCIRSINDKENKIEELKRVSQLSHNIQIILRYVDNNKGILDRLPYDYSKEYFIKGIIDGNSFNEINHIYPAIHSANILELYKKDSETLTKLKSEYLIYESKNEIIKEIENDIDRANKKLNEAVKDIESFQASLLEDQKLLQDKNYDLSNINTAIELYTHVDDIERSINDNNMYIESISQNLKFIEISIGNINRINSDIINIKNELEPLLSDRDKIRYSIDRLIEYNSELQQYQSKYDNIELIKKYTSPSKSGIQSLFIKMYMGQTLNLANSLLSMLFEGTLELKDYIINDKEFRIPCKSLESPIINDDISSCSTAQRCMISMILSFSLLQQGSTKYNILRLDEIDGGLDQDNRAMFISVLNKIIDIMNVENCIMVSHSSENVLENVDIILLNPANNELTDIPNGNIIFTY